MNLITVLPDTAPSYPPRSHGVVQTPREIEVLDKIVADIREAMMMADMSSFSPADLGWHYHVTLRNILEEVAVLDRYRLKVIRAEDDTTNSVSIVVSDGGSFT